MRRRFIVPLAVLPLALVFYGFAPFSQVQDVCPTCEKPKEDVVVFTTGLKVSCRVVAQNSDYYVLEKFGELRAAGRTEVTNIEWANPQGTPNLTAYDQVLTRNNVVYTGSVVAEQKGRYVIIQVGTNRHTIWASQVYSMHKRGAPYSLTGQPIQPSAAPAAVPGSPATAPATAPAAAPTAAPAPSPATAPAPIPSPTLPPNAP